jgi:hypothetical protein
MDRVNLIASQLDRTLGFFGRAEQKASLVFGSNIGLIAVALINLDYLDLTTWYVALPLFGGLMLIACSYTSLYQAAYPRIEGGKDSLFYFNEVGQITETKYVERFLATSAQELEKDLLGQIWRNSQILRDKFTHVKSSFQFTLAALLPLILFLVASSYTHSRMIKLA